MKSVEKLLTSEELQMQANLIVRLVRRSPQIVLVNSTPELEAAYEAMLNNKNTDHQDIIGGYKQEI